MGRREGVVNPILPPCNDIQRQADVIRADQRTHNASLILNVFCLDGYIPAG
jgi:hypothetical protein